ncbi:MAG TPA: hypothetical protein VJ654_14930 [Noviherbaspirillum sp.]|nr:hypothetical protein [Noviherbaspirillum sp.]
MKASISLLFALGVAYQPVLAQVQAPASDMRQSPAAGTQQPQEQLRQSPNDMEMQPQPGMGMPSGSSSGPSTMPSKSQAGTMPDASSGGTNGMHSEAGMELRAAAPAVDELKPMVQGDVTYLCGGVGSDEAAYMKSEAKNYDLMLTFAARNGAYLANVDVDIADAKGNSVLQANCDAPIMLVDLPKSGNYRVRADAAGYTQNRTIKVATGKKKRQHVAAASMVWPQQVAEGPASANTSTGDGSRDQGSREAGGGNNDSGSSNDDGVR